uniref:Protein FRA10AC1 n=1 Tax=Fagus sylvatica TaxID=28930 RepID=A0A2N9HUC2_FAGSY
MTSFRSLKSEIFDREERKQQYQAHILGLNAYDRHKKFLKDYVSFYGKENSRSVKLPVKTDQDTLREGYRFIRTEEDDLDPSWEQRLIGLRWRTEKEVISGKGQFICGNKHCDEKDGLASYEASVPSSIINLLLVNFCYSEAGENKQALVKLVTCERCADKLHYKRRKEKEQSEKREQEENRRKRNRSRSSDERDNDYEGSKERRKGKKASISTDDQKVDDDDNFDEFLEGMFP